MCFDWHIKRISVRKIVTIFYLFLSYGLSAQNPSIKVIVDAMSKRNLGVSYISSIDKTVNLLSNNKGEFVFIKNKNISQYTVYKMGYEIKNVSSEYFENNDTVFLVQNLLELNEVVIREKKMDTIIKDKRFYIDDYLVLPNNDFLIIASKMKMYHFEIMYYKKDKGITCTKLIRNENQPELTSDCFKNFHLLTNSYSRQIIFTSDSSFDFLPKYTRAKFDSALGIAVLKIDSMLLIKKEEKTRMLHSKHFSMKQVGQFLDYYKIFKNEIEFFYRVEYNNDLRNMIKNELNDWEIFCFAIDPPTSIDAAIQGIQNFETLIVKKIYAPIYLKNDTIVIFNFQEKEIVLSNKMGKELNKSKMKTEEFPLLRDYSIIYDQSQQKFYFKTKGYDKATLSQVTIVTGKLVQKIKIEKPFAKNIQISNSNIYYLVSEKQWDDTKYLYAQTIHE